MAMQRVESVWLRPAVLKGKTGATGAVGAEATHSPAGHCENATVIASVPGCSTIAGHARIWTAANARRTAANDALGLAVV